MSKYSELSADVRAVRQDVNGLRSDMTAGFAAMNQRLDGLHTRIDTLIDAIASVRRDLSEHGHGED